jgi:hypothetical protein
MQRGMLPGLYHGRNALIGHVLLSAAAFRDGGSCGSYRVDQLQVLPLTNTANVFVVGRL